MVREAETVIDSLKRTSDEGYVDPFKFSIIYAGLRDVEQTLLYLSQSYDNRSRELIYLACNPQFSWLRDNEQFNDLLAKIGLK